MSLFLVALSSCSNPRPTLSDDNHNDRHDDRRHDRDDDDRDDDDRHWWN